MFDTQTPSLKEQRSIVLDALKQGPATTADLRELGVFSAAASVKALRNEGLYIVTVKAKDNMAKYALFEDCKIKQAEASQY